MRKSNTEKLRDVIKRYVDDNGLEGKLTEVELISSWEELTGSLVASYTQSLRISNGTLWVKVSSPVVKNELMMMKEDIRGRLNAKAGHEIVRDIIFR